MPLQLQEINLFYLGGVPVPKNAAYGRILRFNTSVGKEGNV
jgi:hypothetical protein